MFAPWCALVEGFNTYLEVLTEWLAVTTHRVSHWAQVSDGLLLCHSAIPSFGVGTS